MADAAENRRGHRRPTALTADVADVIVATVAGGGTLGEAARAAGVSERTLRSWLAAGRSQPQGVLLGRVLVSKPARELSWEEIAAALERERPDRWGLPGLDPLADVFAEVDPD